MPFHASRKRPSPFIRRTVRDLNWRLNRSSASLSDVDSLTRLDCRRALTRFLLSDPSMKVITPPWTTADEWSYALLVEAARCLAWIEDAPLATPRTLREHAVTYAQRARQSSPDNVLVHALSEAIRISLRISNRLPVIRRSGFAPYGQWWTGYPCTPHCRPGALEQHRHLTDCSSIAHNSTASLPLDASCSGSCGTGTPRAYFSDCRPTHTDVVARVG